MFRLWGPAAGLLDRREMLRVGGLTLPGMTLPFLFDRTAGAASPAKPAAARGKSFGKAKNCIMLYLSGGPAHLDMWDPKPDAPDDIRGEFKTIPTSVTGVRFTELIPNLAKWMNRCSLVRTMQHDHNDHGRGSYWMFTGYMYPGGVAENNSMTRQDMPHMGAVLAKLAPGGGMFPWALVPHRMDVAGGRRAGQFAGNLGPRYDPLLPGGNPNDDNFRLEHLPLSPNEPAPVFQRRMGLLDQLSAQAQDLQKLAISQSIRDNQAKALDVLASDKVRKAVDLSKVEKSERERYGRNLFGQSVLLGKRLIDAGARLVQCNWQRTQGKDGFAWDTHWNNFEAHRDYLVPPFDKAFHALMTDLERTGQIEETLVIVAAEFGRSPKITRSNSGREHWPSVYSVVFAGAGIQKGVVHGQSDKIGAYPATTPTTPADFTATCYHLLGIDHHSELHDQVNRPFQLSKGNPIGPILV